MANYKVTWSWCYKKAGYSFSLFQTSLNPDLVLSQALDFQERTLSLLGVGVTAEYIRISDEANQGDSITRSRVIGAAGTGALTTDWEGSVQAAEDDPPEPGNVALMVTLSAGLQGSGRLFLRFIPDSLVKRGPTFVPTTTWTIKYNEWYRFITTAPAYQIRIIPKVGMRRKLLTIIRTEGGAFDGLLQLTFLAPHNLVPGDVVSVRGLAGSPHAFLGNPTGVVITTPDLVGATVSYRGLPFVTPVLSLNTGWVLKQTKSYLDVIQPTIAISHRIVGHKIGRPFGQPVGRRSTT